MMHLPNKRQIVKLFLLFVYMSSKISQIINITRLLSDFVSFLPLSASWMCFCVFQNKLKSIIEMVRFR